MFVNQSKNVKRNEIEGRKKEGGEGRQRNVIGRRQKRRKGRTRETQGEMRGNGQLMRKEENEKRDRGNMK